MPTKTLPETAAQATSRRILTLRDAYQHLGTTFLGAHERAVETYALLRATTYAVVPGRQKAKNIATLLDQATKAAARVIRRRA